MCATPDCPEAARARRLYDEAAANVAAGVSTEDSGSRHMDEDARSPGLSRWARRQQRATPQLRVDEYGYDREGNHYPQHDGTDERDMR